MFRPEVEEFEPRMLLSGMNALPTSAPAQHAMVGCRTGGSKIDSCGSPGPMVRSQPTIQNPTVADGRHDAPSAGRDAGGPQNSLLATATDAAKAPDLAGIDAGADFVEAGMPTENLIGSEFLATLAKIGVTDVGPSSRFPVAIVNFLSPVSEPIPTASPSSTEPPDVASSLDQPGLERGIPQGLGLMGGQSNVLPMADLPALERALLEFLAELGGGAAYVDSADGTTLWTCILAAAAAAAACEIARRQYGLRGDRPTAETSFPDPDDIFPEVP